jgi:hypothetical protein
MRLLGVGSALLEKTEQQVSNSKVIGLDSLMMAFMSPLRGLCPG